MLTTSWVHSSVQLDRGSTERRSDQDSSASQVSRSLEVQQSLRSGRANHPALRKSSVGPDLGRLFIGAEGTLGIVTEGKRSQKKTLKLYALVLSPDSAGENPSAATLKLAPLLPSTVAVSSFPTIAAAAAAARDLVQNGVSLACIELLDEVMVAATNAQTKNGKGRQWPVKPR